MYKRQDGYFTTLNKDSKYTPDDGTATKRLEELIAEYGDRLYTFDNNATYHNMSVLKEQLNISGGKRKSKRGKKTRKGRGKKTRKSSKRRR